MVVNVYNQLPKRKYQSLKRNKGKRYLIPKLRFNNNIEEISIPFDETNDNSTEENNNRKYAKGSHRKSINVNFTDKRYMPEEPNVKSIHKHSYNTLQKLKKKGTYFLNGGTKKSVRINSVVTTRALNTSNNAREARKSGHINRFNTNELDSWYKNLAARYNKTQRIKNHKALIKNLVGSLSPSKSKQIVKGGNIETINPLVEKKLQNLYDERKSLVKKLTMNNTRRTEIKIDIIDQKIKDYIHNGVRGLRGSTRKLMNNVAKNT